MYKTLWFWLHWLLGIVFGVILLIVGATGAILSYEKEILQIINKDTYFVQAPQNKERLNEVEILQIFQKENPNYKINSIGFSSAKDSSMYVNIAKEGERRGVNIYLNPYTAEVLPQIKGKDFFMFNFRLHRWLALDGGFRSVGKHIVALATLAAIVLTVSGIIVYWPRIKNNFLKSIIFSFKQKNRVFLSSMHSALGLWVVPFFLLMCLTGLYWSYEWYRGAMYSALGVEQPKRVMQQGAWGKNKDIAFDDISVVIDLFKETTAKGFKNANLRLDQSKDGTYAISYLFDNAKHFRASNTAEIDPKEKKLVKEAKYEDKKLNEKIMNSMLPLHSGEFFGWFGKFAYFISSALMALFVITGYMLYFDRWKKKRVKILKK
ncbi:MAG: PepSY domain-containing protein [Sulfurospirillaceae bacterium]|nr:PepSY domain-containing protein [Sulfurospirillaceae bacterium]